MTTLTLQRLVEFPKECMLGKIYAENGTVLCRVLERPWLGNARNISCIPLGEYPVVPRYSEKYREHFLVKDTAPRTYILLHSGNVSTDTLGCILPGFSYGVLSGRPAVLGSRNALHMLLNDYPDGFTLSIQGPGE